MALSEYRKLLLTLILKQLALIGGSSTFNDEATGDKVC
jgi:hypothetical protein